MDWRLVTEFFLSVGYGLLSSFVPVFNSEVYIVAAQALGRTAEVTVAVGVAVGQVIGKTGIVLALRDGTKLPVLAKPISRLRERFNRSKPHRKPPGKIRLTFQKWSKRLLDLAGTRWGALIVYLSGATAIPPMLALQFVIPATKMPIWVFSTALLLGRCTLFLAIAFGASAVVERVFGW